MLQISIIYDVAMIGGMEYLKIMSRLFTGIVKLQSKEMPHLRLILVHAIVMARVYLKTISCLASGILRLPSKAM